MNSIRCRFCGKSLKHTFVDLGMSPPANAYVKADELQKMEAFFPLHVYVCEKCYLVQLPEHQSPEQIFDDYAYFSSYSETWLTHVKAYTEEMIKRFNINAHSHVIEIASNDGYLLQYFKDSGIPVLGVEPARNVAQSAIDAGIPTIVQFFGTHTAIDMKSKGENADLLIGNNVLAHVPNLNDFVRGLKELLSQDGIITMEFPHLMRLMEGNQFDTIYHEHFSYFSFLTVQELFSAHGLTIFDVDELSTHGGSLRIYACHAGNTTQFTSKEVFSLTEREIDAGYRDMKQYTAFGAKVKSIKRNILSFMIDARKKGKKIVGYGAPAKGNTLLNYCGMRTDFIDYTVDRNPHKQGHYLPGSHIPIYPPDKIKETQPDIVLILPWNIKEEIMDQMSHIRAWDGKFAVFIPEINTF